MTEDVDDQLRRSQAKAQEEASWCSALLAFREAYRRGYLTNAFPIPGGERLFIMHPYPLTPEQRDAAIQWADFTIRRSCDEEASGGSKPGEQATPVNTTQGE